MNFFKRATRAFSRHGLQGSIQKGYIVLVDLLYDRKYGIQTVGWATLDQLTVAGENKSHGNRYEPLRVVILRKFFRTITPHLPPQPVLVDIGGGKGRVLFVASEFSFEKAIGVEFAAELAEAGKRNIIEFQKHSSSTTKLVMVHADAAVYAIEPDQNVFLIFNPFDSSVLRKVLANIQSSLEQHPRPMLISFFNNEYGDLLEKQLGFRVVEDVSYVGYSFVVYSNNK